MFFSKDVETLLPLPIKENKIVMAKMNVLIISEYLTGLLILAPVLVVYGYMLKLGALYVPVDNEYPEERIKLILEDCKPKVVIVDEKYESLIQDGTLESKFEEAEKEPA